MLTNNNLTGTQLKLGARYFLSPAVSFFANFGSINKVPILDQAIDDEDYLIIENPVQENFTSIEIGSLCSGRCRAISRHLLQQILQHT